MGEAERGDAAPRRRIAFFCVNGHETRPAFAAEAAEPDRWECPSCGLPAGRDRDNPPEAPHIEPYKTHLAYVRERRTDTDADAILDEALGKLRERRGR